MALVFCLLILDKVFPLALPHNDQLFARIVVDDSGRPLRAFADSSGVWRYPVTIENVSSLYIEALINYEDKWFWYHPGVNPLSLLRATWQNLSSGKIVSGGSTLSMQVARLLHPHARSLLGKSQQLLRTLQLEWRLSKAEILTLYLNIAPFGGTIEGVQAASFHYLNKSAAQLSHAEAALLTVLPQAPTRLRPDIHPDLAEQARNKVLDRLAAHKIWSEQITIDAKQEQVYAFRNQQPKIAPLLARRLLSHSDGQQAIKTTINGELQGSLEDYLQDFVQGLPNKNSAAILVAENKTGAVKAYLGSANFLDDTRFGHVDMIQAKRSPGSTLKPFLFGLSLDESLIHSHSLLADVPRSWGDYHPGNFNGSFSGPVSAAEALQRSLNLPFIDLLERYGPRKFNTRLRNAGLQLSIPGHNPNLSIILGGAGASLEELVTVYMALGREGGTTKLKYRRDELEGSDVERYFLSPASAWITRQVLSEIKRPGSLNTLASMRKKATLAWKTGTSFGFRDSWAIGVSKDYTIGVWVGRPDGTAQPGHSGRETAAPLLFTVADYLNFNVATVDEESYRKPISVEKKTICWPLGTLKTKSLELCHREYQAWILDGVIPPTWHSTDSDAWQSNPITVQVSLKTSKRVMAGCMDDQSTEAKQIALWPKILEPWIPYYLRRNGQIPTMDEGCDKGYSATSSLHIMGIVDGSKFRSAGGSEHNPIVTLQAVGGEGRYHWYINGVRRFSGKSNRIIPYPLENKGDVQILVIDDDGNIDYVSILVI